MPDNRFYNNQGPFSLGQIAELIETQIAEKFQNTLIDNVSPPQLAEEKDICLFMQASYADKVAISKAAACITQDSLLEYVPARMVALIVPKPYRAWAKVLNLFYPQVVPASGISPHAVVSSSAEINEGCCIEAGVVIGENVVIGANSWIQSGTVIDQGVTIGDQAHIGPNVTISHSLIGMHVKIKPGAKIGQKGFGFDRDEQGHLDIPQLGRVIIGNHVEIGANTTIDRGALGDTVIGDGCRIDNLVQIAHNVALGKGCIVVAQVGIAGSTRLGNYVAIGGQAGLTGHLEIGDMAQIAAQSGVMRNVGAKEIVAGAPAIPAREWHKQTVALKRLIQDKKK